MEPSAEAAGVANGAFVALNDGMSSCMVEAHIEKTAVPRTAAARMPLSNGTDSIVATQPGQPQQAITAEAALLQLKQNCTAKKHVIASTRRQRHRAPRRARVPRSRVGNHTRQRPCSTAILRTAVRTAAVTAQHS